MQIRDIKDGMPHLMNHSHLSVKEGGVKAQLEREKEKKESASFLKLCLSQDDSANNVIKAKNCVGAAGNDGGIKTMLSLSL